MSTPWSSYEDSLLTHLASRAPRPLDWRRIAKCFESKRTHRACRDRWTNHLDPNTNTGAFTREENEQLYNFITKNPSKWMACADALGTNRTSIMIKSQFERLEMFQRRMNETSMQMPKQTALVDVENALDQIRKACKDVPMEVWMERMPIILCVVGLFQYKDYDAIRNVLKKEGIWIQHLSRSSLRKIICSFLHS